MAHRINGKLGELHAGKLAKTSKGKAAGTTVMDPPCGRTRLAKVGSCALVLAAVLTFIFRKRMYTQWGSSLKSEEGFDARLVRYGKFNK